MIDFDKLAADLAKATPGPWRYMTRYSFVSYKDSYQVVWDVPASTAMSLIADTGSIRPSAKHDASLIAAAPDLARLALLVPELREALKACEQEIDGYILQEYPLDHPVHERCRDRDLSANPARAVLAKLNALLEGK